MILCSLYWMFIIKITVFADDENAFYRVNLIGLNNQTSQNYLGNKNRNSSLAVDDNIGTCSYITEHPDTLENPWWQIELDRFYDITHVRLLYDVESYFGRNVLFMSVFISNSTTQGQLCIKFRNISFNQFVGHLDLQCENVIVGKFVKLSKIESNLVLCEVHIFAVLTSVNLAYKRPYQLNDFFALLQADRIIDGNLSTCSVLIASEEKESFIMIDLESDYYVTDVNLHYHLLTKEIHVFVSKNYENFEEQLCSSIQIPPNDSTKKLLKKYLKCSRPMLGRFVTIKIPDEIADDTLLICEFAVYSRGRPQGMINVTIPSCLSHEYKCLAGECIHRDWICDGTVDCPYADDESPSCRVDKSLFKCIRRNESISISFRCDGIWQCSDYSDEERCFDLPKGSLTKATFKGVANHYICSDGWTTKLSVEICNEYNRDHTSTNHVPINETDETVKFITLNTQLTISLELPFVSYFTTGESCNTNKIINVGCDSKKDKAHTCGKRGFSESFFERYIINGREAQTGAWPWHAQIKSKFGSCGGSLLNDRWILTAAHCFGNGSVDINVKLGTNNRNDYYSKDVPVSHMIKHPDFNGKHNDIALLRLKERQTYTQYIRPICLPVTEMNHKTLMSYQHCIVAGYGYIDKDGTIPTRLQQLRMNIIPTVTCAKILYGDLWEIMFYELNEVKLFCAGQLPFSSGKSPCKGDSGSPLVCKSTNGIWTQIGIVQGSVSLTGPKCQNSVFVKVDQHLNFIHTVMSKVYKSNVGRILLKHAEFISSFLVNIFLHLSPGTLRKHN